MSGQPAGASCRRNGQASCTPTLQEYRGVALWTGGAANAPLDVWFHPAFADSHLSYRAAFTSPLDEHARVFVFDPPGHGASPALPGGLTLATAARLWCDLIAEFSKTRPVVLVGHSMAGLIASRTARALPRPPVLVIGVEANLTRADAYFTGLAVRFQTPVAFYESFRSRMRRMARRNDCIQRFACSVEFADPLTLWTLGRSVAAQSDAGRDFRRLQCPKVYYHDPANTSAETRVYLARFPLPQRELKGLGHWPMIEAPKVFYAAVARDMLGVDPLGTLNKTGRSSLVDGKPANRCAI